MGTRPRQVRADDLKFTPCDPADGIAEWLAADTWPFHGGAKSTWFGEHIRSFWIDAAEPRIGIIRIFDLGDTTPLFDLRIRTPYRGRGLGRAALKWIADYVFTNHPATHRLGGYTRADNLPMRRTFESCGWVKEAHYRQGWSGVFDAVGYGILRSEWKSS